jgi:hypothetical protein
VKQLRRIASIDDHSDGNTIGPNGVEDDDDALLNDDAAIMMMLMITF